MTVNRTTLLDLPLPVTGTESGTWGNVTNNGLTQYLDIAIAGALSVTSSVTLDTTEGDSAGTNIASTTAQYRTLLVPASGPSGNIVITAPASNRTYHVVNLNATYTVQVRAGAGTGVTIGVNQSATVSFNGTDYASVGPISNSLTLAGTAATTMTFPSTSATIARTDAGQTFTGTQVMTSPRIVTSIKSIPIKNPHSPLCTFTSFERLLAASSHFFNANCRDSREPAVNKPSHHYSENLYSLTNY